jgi:formylglycine-generating enzyme required for sulfatase activity
MKKIPLIAFGMAAMCLVATAQVPIAAPVPNRINYQGRLTDRNGQPMKGTADMAVRIFTNETGGASVWVQSIGSVALRDGVYGFAFGDNDLPAALDHPECWLELRVDGKALAPRQRLVAVAYAVSAGKSAVSDRAVEASSLAQTGATNLFSSAAYMTALRQAMSRIWPAAMDVEPSSLTLTVLDNGQDSELIGVRNDGIGPMAYQCNVTYESGANWLSVTPANHSMADGATKMHAVTVNGGAVTAGTYTARIALDGNQTNAAQIVTVAFTRINTPPGMALILGGSFQMGDALDGLSDAPLHPVSVNAFFMDKYEVTKAKWDEVATWAAGHGYDISAADGSGKATNHPVQTVSWYSCVKWCNARSEKEGLQPCYYTDGARTTVYRAGNVDVPTNGVDWVARGYRLPTEAEWEKAARGGAAGKRFPWSDADTISHSRANYNAGGGEAYDLSNGLGYHDGYETGGQPYTSPVGVFAPNGYGLYDMAGNVWEWCWDWHGSAYYDSSPVTNPRGPTSGSQRVVRGGSWGSGANGCRSAGRNGYNPGNRGYGSGFRTVLPPGQQ